MGRSKFVTASPKKVMPHGDFIERIRKSLYYGMSSDSYTDEADSDMEVSRPLAEYAADLFSEPHRGHSLNRLTRVAAGKSHATPCSLIMALIYLDRLNVIDPGYVRRITPQELFVVSLMISTKFYAGYDQQFYLEDWAKEGNMSEDKLRLMELEFLSAIDWNIYISNEHFFEKLNNVERTLAQREGLRRGWLTYSELMQLLPSFTLMKFLLNSITVMAVSYAASVMTIAGAFFLASQIPGTMLYRKSVPANATATTTVSDTIVVPTASDDATQATPITILRPNDTIQSSTSSTLPSNANCSALNVEAELLKLEQQYCNEARLNDIRHERLASNDATRLKLPHATTVQQYNTKADDMAHNWLAIKSEYSDSNQLKMQFGNYDVSFGNTNLYEDCLNSQNISSIWQLFNGVMAWSVIERMPAFWSKFI